MFPRSFICYNTDIKTVPTVIFNKTRHTNTCIQIWCTIFNNYHILLSHIYLGVLIHHLMTCCPKLWAPNKIWKYYYDIQTIIEPINWSDRVSTYKIKSTIFQKSQIKNLNPIFTLNKISQHFCLTSKFPKKNVSNLHGVTIFFFFSGFSPFMHIPKWSNLLHSLCFKLMIKQ